MRRLSRLQEEIEVWTELKAQTANSDELLTLALEEKDDSLLETFQTEIAGIESRLNDLEFSLVLSGEYDDRSAIVALHAGAGGVESQEYWDA